MSITEQIQKNLGKKFSGNLALNKEVLRWKKSLTEVNKKLGGGNRKMCEKAVLPLDGRAVFS